MVKEFITPLPITQPKTNCSYLDALEGLEVFVRLGVVLGKLLSQVRANVRVHFLHTLRHLQRVL